MIQDVIAHRYAKSLWRLADERGVVEQVGREIRGLASMAFSVEKYRTFWENPTVPLTSKIQLLESILGIFLVSAETDGFLHLLVRKGRFGLLPAAVDWYEQLADVANGVVRVRVVAAVELEPDAVERIKDAMEKRLECKTKITTEVDPALLGGVAVRIGNDIIDGSVKGRLTRMLERMKRGSAI